MKSIDELLIAWRDESITAAELKELERLLAEPGARERLFEEFLTTATIAEALKVDTASPKVRDLKQRPAARPAPRFRWWPGAVAAAVMLATAIYFYATSQAPSGFQIVAGSALVDQKKDGPIGENSVVECEGSNSATIRFPDGSTMDLAASSSSVLHRRSVDLKAGKASFQIQKVQNVADAFSVKTAVGSVTVVGTKFSVELQPKGKNTQGGTEMRSAIVMAVAVLAGSVSVEFNGSHYALAMGQSRAFGADTDAAPAVANNDTKPTLPAELKGFNSGINGQVVSVSKDSIVLKLGPSSKKEYADLKDKEVVLITKDVKNLPELKAGDKVYGSAAEVDGQLVAKSLAKLKAP